MIDLKFAFLSMIDRSGFDRSDRSFSRIVWPLIEIIASLTTFTHNSIIMDIHHTTMDIHNCGEFRVSIITHTWFSYEYS